MPKASAPPARRPRRNYGPWAAHPGVPASARRRTGSDEPPVQPAKKGTDLGRPAGVNDGTEFGVDPVQHLSRPAPGAVAGLHAGDQLKREPFDPLDGIARCAPCSCTGSCKDCGTRPFEIGGEIAGQRIEFAKAEIERKRAMQRSILRPSSPSAAAARSRRAGRCADHRRARGQTRAGHRGSASP